MLVVSSFVAFMCFCYQQHEVGLPSEPDHDQDYVEPRKQRYQRQNWLEPGGGGGGGGGGGRQVNR